MCRLIQLFLSFDCGSCRDQTCGTHQCPMIITTESEFTTLRFGLSSEFVTPLIFMACKPVCTDTSPMYKQHKESIYSNAFIYRSDENDNHDIHYSHTRYRESSPPCILITFCLSIISEDISDSKWEKMKLSTCILHGRKGFINLWGYTHFIDSRYHSLLEINTSASISSTVRVPLSYKRTPEEIDASVRIDNRCMLSGPLTQWEPHKKVSSSAYNSPRWTPLLHLRGDGVSGVFHCFIACFAWNLRELPKKYSCEFSSLLNAFGRTHWICRAQS